MTNFDTTQDADIELLSAYIDNQLAPGERATLEARLEREPALRQTLNELRFTVAALRELEPVRPPRSFALDPAAVQPQRSFWQLSATWMRFGSALAALLLAITVTLDVGGRGAASTATQPPANGQTTGGAGASAPTAAAAAPMMQRATEATSAPAAESMPAEQQAEASMDAAAATAAPAAGGMAAAPTIAAASSAMSAAATPGAGAQSAENPTAADSTTANVPMVQSSGSSSPGTTNIEKYNDQQQAPQIVPNQPRSLLVLEIALGALALLLLAGSFWAARRKA